MQQPYINGLVQDCSNSIANALELLQSCTKPSICWLACTAITMPADALATWGARASTAVMLIK